MSDEAKSSSTAAPLVESTQYGVSIGSTAVGVNVPCERYYELEAAREPCRDLLAGLPRLRSEAKRDVYIPRNPAEKPKKFGNQNVDPYLNRINASRLDNKLRRAVASDAGRVFDKEPALTAETPQALKDWAEDVDGLGNKLSVFLLGTGTRAIGEGMSGVLIDYPRVDVRPGEDGRLSKSEARAAGVQPTLKLFSPANVIDWEYAKIGGRVQLVTLRLREPYVVQEGPFKRTTKVQVRVLHAGLNGGFAWFELYRESADPQRLQSLEWEVVDVGEIAPQTEIPFVSFETDFVAPFESVPHYLDLAYLNLAQFVKTSYLDSGQVAIGFPIPWAAGLPVDPKTGKILPLSEDRMILFNDPAGSVGIAETSGSAWGSVLDTIKHMDEQAAQASGETEFSGALTATGEVRRSIPSASRLGSYVDLFKDSATRCLRFVAIYMELVKPNALEGWGGVDFFPQLKPVQPTPMQMEERRWLHSIGAISTETCFDAAKRSGAIDEDLDFEEEQEAVAREMPKMPEPDLGGEPPDDEPPLDEQAKPPVPPKPNGKEGGAVEEAA